MTVLLAASPGGHLDELEAVAPAFASQRRVWVTLEGPRGDELRRRGEDVRFLPPYERQPIAQARMWAAAVRLVGRLRPSVVVTTGAGATVPVCWAARALGAAVFFVETSARLSAPSMTGRLVGPMATEVFVQWPELREHFRRPVVCRPILFDAAVAATSGPGRGSVAFVGTHTSPFTRLLDLVDGAARAGILPGPVVMQTGAAEGYAPVAATARPYVTPGEADALMRDARYVLCHGGAGSIAGALRHGRRPLVLSRRERHGEHFDDHQLQLVGRLSDLGLVVGLEDAITPEHLALADAPLEGAWGQAWGPSVCDAVAERAQRLGLAA